MSEKHPKKKEQKTYDGPFEVSAIEISNEGEIFKGMVYFPPKEFSKPYPVILYFHEFPQIFTLSDIVKRYKFFLNLGYAFIAVNFRGYRYSEGKVSINSQVSDGLKLIEFSQKMGEKGILKGEDINILANDLGAYIALIVCSKSGGVNKLGLIAPIIDLRRHVYDEEFIEMLNYVKRFLAGNVQGIENVKDFLEMTKKELSKKEFQITFMLENLKVKKLKVILGKNDKITPRSDLKLMSHLSSNIKLQTSLIESMDHHPLDKEEILRIKKELITFFKKE
jgi:hypothetical protein